MKTHKPVPSDALNSKLAAYSATAVAALVMAPAAEATIQNITTFSVNGGPFSTSPPSATGPLNNFNPNAASNIVTFIAGTANNKSAFRGTLAARAVYASEATGRVFIDNQGNHIAGTGGLASKLTLGAPINHLNFSASAGKRLLASRHSSTPGGNFVPASSAQAHKTGYIGFKTHLHGKTYYGWLWVQISNNHIGWPSVGRLEGNPDIFGAFGLASDNILAGEVAAPEPSTLAIGGLGLLAFGARGVREMRRRRALENK